MKVQTKNKVIFGVKAVVGTMITVLTLIILLIAVGVSKSTSFIIGIVTTLAIGVAGYFLVKDRDWSMDA